jgi:DNA (cytosine-5)-methyltransferase 3A
MSCGQIALNNLGYEVEYYASEINKPSIHVTKHNYPNTTFIGDVTKVSYSNGVLHTENGDFKVGIIDLVIGGSPCQSISNLGKGEGLDGKSGLFFHWLRIKNEVNPTYWLLENVRGNKRALNEITKLVGVEPTEINSNLVSAQNRRRLYWTNIKNVLPPENKNLKLKDILDTEIAEESILTIGRLKWLLSEKGQQCIQKRYATIDPEKASCLTARSDASWNCNYVSYNNSYRKLSCNEYEKLQTVPINYTKVEGVKPKHRYEMLGNGWTVDVISHILSFMKFTDN